MKALLTSETTPWLRNLIRVGVGYVIGSSDPMLLDLMAAFVWAGVEVYYYIAKRNGWPT